LLVKNTNKGTQALRISYKTRLNEAVLLSGGQNGKVHPETQSSTIRRLAIILPVVWIFKI
jgi:hypothetical protein